ncbi:ribose 5-phosphate isomerase A [Deinococcus yavapaiensis]|uniref:Ribose-5-phosphate isomerase A n=1 Tax=Deinococcus yavapaiensis KR-236 TaxID=694435 RepID=A0A318S3H1_9DEIO|nr:ribose 5-phosphate isomerase A [Deinococcus yavapaiensis]PYE48961.1 ribose-5-phosphate isomerase [Deinococcus yavapaiensis KR-236]
MPHRKELKQEAAVRAAALVESGMRVGLGTGSTAKYAILELGRRLREGELTDIVGVPTSDASDTLARAQGIEIVELGTLELDLAIDGADEIDPNLDLIKGLGGALTREKLVELRAKRLVIIADDAKLVTRLGEKAALPIEVVRFGFESTLARLADLGARGTLREQGGQAYVTDNGNYIFDARFGDALPDAATLAERLKLTPGVVEHGLFLGMATQAFVASSEGVREIPARSRTS